MYLISQSPWTCKQKLVTECITADTKTLLPKNDRYSFISMFKLSRSDIFYVKFHADTCSKEKQYYHIPSLIIYWLP